MSHRVSQHRRNLHSTQHRCNIHDIAILRKVSIMVMGKCVAWVSAASTTSHECLLSSVRIEQRFCTFITSPRLHACFFYFYGVRRIMQALVRSRMVKQGFGKITRTSLFVQNLPIVVCLLWVLSQHPKILFAFSKLHHGILKWKR